MISRINIRNYKGLYDFSFSPNDKNGFIYGENGSGKSSFVDAMYFLMRTMRTLLDNDRIYSLPSRVQGLYPELESEEMLFQLSRSKESLAELLRRGRAISAASGPSFEMEFRKNDKRFIYAASFDEGGVVRESLSSEYGDRMLKLFSFSPDDIFLSPAAFADNNYKKELLDKIDRYYGQNTFMAILYSELMSSSARYFRSKVSEDLSSAIDFLSDISIVSEEGIVPSSLFRRADIVQGYSDLLPEKERKDIERMINLYLPYVLPLHSRAYYRTYIAGNRECYELWFDKNGISIPISSESKGIQRLTELFPFFLSALMGETVIIDATDSGISDKILLGIYSSLDKDAEGQLIASVSSEYIVANLSKEHAYIISNMNGRSVINLYSSDSMKESTKLLNADEKVLLEFREMMGDISLK